MAIIRDGNKAVLLVVDVQVGVMQNSWDAPQVIKNIGLAVEKARRQDVPVIWMQHSDEELIRDSSEWQLVPELSPVDGEVRIHKQFNSSFEQTSLEETLTKLGATNIVLAGAATNWCIRATAYGALERGYDLTLIKDGHTTDTIPLENGVNIDAQDVIRDLNITMTWLSYPGRTNTSISAADIDFAS
jgi:nicotinamidase-related amidase